MNIFTFLKGKTEKKLDEIDNGIELIKKRGISYAQSAAEFIEFSWKGDNKDVIKKLFEVGKKVNNSLNQEGLLFKDGSILLKTKNEFKGLNLNESDSWKQGIGFEEFTPIKYEIGHKITLRSGCTFKVVNFDLNAEMPITLDIAGYGHLSYYNEGKAVESENSGFDILCLPKTVSLFEEELTLSNKPKLK